MADIPSARLYLFKASRCVGPEREDGVPFVIEGLAAVARANDRIIEGMNTDTLGRDYRHDECHLNSRAGAVIADRPVSDLERRAFIRTHSLPA